MTIEKTVSNEATMVVISGRLDTQTAPDLEKALDEAYEGCKDLTLDMTNLEYVSSAGLRILLKAQTQMNKQGCMKITGVNENVMEVLEITGFTDILTIV